MSPWTEVMARIVPGRAECGQVARVGQLIEIDDKTPIGPKPLPYKTAADESSATSDQDGRHHNTQTVTLRSKIGGSARVITISLS